ncbi:plasma-membrane calcium-translocating P-type ATPase/potassium and/or sodium efflux P-type ATPase,TIGR01523 [Mariprofundus ferrinatatus]|uniref:Plasma-membrane calcium-translocating P-type ATPase/potassium and/or sodium efflux P-type ATPase,TIGR01523 n=1 Tax=Mariprofundus ferrinatatus TaxID=1921087 RepID=A0A2K8LCB8_9PROT|nr:cation-transporting P-type ATPase [Mariprofundus ferrinatatus]ATX82544.1 plasma-membrane calcium-translocating P-type ATPase/potassium and/or sodium efflux P-type ATPase,TIGR01523 [Mariprofundus ferrinatatus]
MNGPDIEQNLSWHSVDAEVAFLAMASGMDGLSSTAASERLNRFGENRLKPPPKQSPFKRFLMQFHNVLIYVLLGAGIITSMLGHWVDSGVIFGVVIINAIIGFIQEGKAEKALDAIRNMLSQQAMVKRDGHFMNLPAEQLVPGDVVSLQSGDKVPADLRLFKLRELRIEEAMLTGESMPAEKMTGKVAENASIGDRKNLAFSGTLVTYGQGLGIVVATGDGTEIGRISGLLQTVQTLTTPLLRQMDQFGRWLSIGIGVLAMLTFAFGVLFQSYTASEMFLAAVGLAVAGIPEGLPAIMTITLAIGVQRMARNNAIIRRLPAVETLGSVTVICSDKTGTLTRNEMTVKSVITATGLIEVGGSGYDPHGTFIRSGEETSLDQHPQLRELALASLLCNDASLKEKNGLWQIHGDPTEGALITLALKAGLDQALMQRQFPRIDAIPFESEHRFMATLHHDHAGHGFIYLKGAPESVLEMCHMERRFGEDVPLNRRFWEDEMYRMAVRGERLLAIAFRAVPTEQQMLNFDDVQSGLTLLGIVGIIDPPRNEAIASVQACQKAGIRVKMITGDHGVTAAAIGEQMGIGLGRSVINGVEMREYNDSELQKVAGDHDIFARVSPEQKLQLVTALQANGEVVSMTGDGVNDAPALKRADVGVAMGINGTEVAKEASEMVLTDDNFASIAKAVEEGRTVYDNLKKSILFILPTNGGEAFIIVAAIIMGRALPITAAQILWVNMITAVTLALTLAFEPPESDVMRRPPRKPMEPILSGFLIWRILFVSLVIVTGTFGLFVWERIHGADLAVARSIAVNTLVMFEIFYLFNARYLLAPSLTREGIGGNRYVFYAIALLLLFQIAFTYAAPMQMMFGTADIGPDAWLRIVAVASSVLFLVELEKWLLRRFMQ